MVRETVTLINAVKKMYPVATFFKDRYFPDGKTYYSERALIETKKGGRKVAPFVAPIVNGIVMEREGYRADYVDAPYIIPKMVITAEMLAKKAFGESPESGRSPAQREKEIEAECMDELRKSVLRRHELMCTDIITRGEVIMKHFASAQDAEKGTNYQEQCLRFYDKTFDNVYKFSKDFKTMTTRERILELYKIESILKKRGVKTADIVMTGDVSMLFMADKDFLEYYNKKDVNTGKIDQSKLPDGVAYNGTLNVNGTVFNMFTYDEVYEDLDGTVKEFLPAGTIAFLQPGMGTTVYAQVTFVKKGSGFHSYAQPMVPRVTESEDNNLMEVQVYSRPVPYPLDMDGWMVANINNVSEMSGGSNQVVETSIDSGKPVDDGVSLKTESEINAMQKADLQTYGASIGAPITTDMKVDELKETIIAYQETLE